MKRLVARASLQAATSGQILTPKEFYCWAEAHITGITFLYISSADIEEREKKFSLVERYASVNTIHGTRSHHAFVPISQSSMKMKRISSDDIHSIITLCQAPPCALKSDRGNDRENDYQPGMYVACIYDNCWYIGNIVELSDINSDVLVSFMKRRDTKLSWPHREDKCWIPLQHIICVVDVPQPESQAAQQYQLAIKNYETIKTLYH